MVSPVVIQTSFGEVPEICAGALRPPVTASSIVQHPPDQCRTRRIADGVPTASVGSAPTKKNSSGPADQASVTKNPAGSPTGGGTSVQVAPGGGAVGQVRAGGLIGGVRLPGTPPSTAGGCPLATGPAPVLPPVETDPASWPAGAPSRPLPHAAADRRRTPTSPTIPRPVISVVLPSHPEKPGSWGGAVNLSGTCNVARETRALPSTSMGTATGEHPLPPSARPGSARGQPTPRARRSRDLPRRASRRAPAVRRPDPHASSGCR